MKAATLAHEINNPLQAITNLFTLLKQSPCSETQDRVFAALAAEELDRVAHLTQQSLSFYREPSHPTSVNLEIVLDSVLDLYAKRLFAKEIIVTKDYVLDGATIDSYPGEIRQILSTLLLNVIEAVPAVGNEKRRSVYPLPVSDFPLGRIVVSLDRKCLGAGWLEEGEVAPRHFR